MSSTASQETQPAGQGKRFSLSFALLTPYLEYYAHLWGLQHQKDMGLLERREGH